MKQKRLVFNLLMATGILFSTMSCTNSMKQDQSLTNRTVTVKKAICVLHPTEGSSVSGTVTFSSSTTGVKVVANLKGLTPGKHGFHIHQYGDCSASDGTSAGGHFNPEDVDHGGPDAAVRHVGDLGNIEADADGNAQYEKMDTRISLNGEHSIIGRGVVVHAGEDDLSSQPTGAAGARVACGVIGIAK